MNGPAPPKKDKYLVKLTSVFSGGRAALGPDKESKPSPGAQCAFFDGSAEGDSAGKAGVCTIHWQLTAPIVAELTGSGGCQAGGGCPAPVGPWRSGWWWASCPGNPATTSALLTAAPAATEAAILTARQPAGLPGAGGPGRHQGRAFFIRRVFGRLPGYGLFLR